MSPLVPETHGYTFALGFARFFQGDFVSAGYLLVPQIEPLIRYTLRSAGVDSSRLVGETLQEDRTLSAILDGLRSELDAIFTPGSMSLRRRPLVIVGACPLQVSD
jgi:hypothetical protein